MLLAVSSARMLFLVARFHGVLRRVKSYICQTLRDGSAERAGRCNGRYTAGRYPAAAVALRRGSAAA
jgi:hypothetical protein